MPTKLIAAVMAVFLGLAFVPRLAAQDAVRVEAKASKAAVVPGEQFALAVVLDQSPGWHIHTNAPVAPPGVNASDLIATTIEVTPSAGVTVWSVQWPASEVAQVAIGPKGPVPYRVFAGRSIAYVPVQSPLDAKPGDTLTFKIKYSYQACNDKNCQFPVEDAAEVQVAIISPQKAAAKPTAVPDKDFAGFDATAFGTPPAVGSGPTAVTKKVKFNAFGLAFEIDPAGAGLVLLLLVAALGGFLLNLTPCVLPVVPLKIMGLSAAAGNPRRCFLLGLVMSAGVVAFWLAIGAAIAFVSGFTAINSLFQTPWFSLGVGVFIAIMAIGMMGAYVIQLPQAVYLFNPNHETYPGVFMFGVMTAVLATPCTAPFMGSAAAWAATQHPAITLATFAAIGAGMALPYIILSAVPRWVSRIPRTGPASELIKQVMGLLLVGVAIFFVGTGLDALLRNPIDPPVRFFWWLIAGAAVGAMVWLVYRTFRITRRAFPRAFWTTFATAFSFVSVMIAIAVTDLGPIPWIGYTPERLATAQAQGMVVVVDFTAEWCLNCKALESGVLHRSEVVALLTRVDLVPIRVDLTGNNTAGKAKLHEVGWVGIPLLVVYGPNLSEPIKYDAYTVDMVRDAIARAAKPGSDLAKAAASQGTTPTVTPASHQPAAR